MQAAARLGRITAALVAGTSGAAAGSTVWARVAHADADAPVALNPEEWRSFKLTEKAKVNHDVVSMTFGFDSPDAVSGLPTASCLIVRAPIGSKKEDGTPKMVIRPYTPVSRSAEKGAMRLLVKVYPEGAMSKHLGEMKVGDSIDIKGPIMKIEYKPNMKKKIGMIAGGSGVTPMLQVIDAILDNPEDNTEVSFILANKTRADIVPKDYIDKLAAKHKNFNVYYVVDKPPLIGWTGGVGYITEDMIKEHMPPPADASLVLVCGPPPMMKAISGDKNPDKSQGEVTGLLGKLGYSSDTVFKF